MDMEKVLEFRGIPIHHLGMYLEELGAEGSDQTLDSLPALYKACEWSAEIASEEIIAFTANFKVNAVKIRFLASGEQGLNEVIKRFRYKTTRVGG